MYIFDGNLLSMTILFATYYNMGERAVFLDSGFTNVLQIER